MQSEPGAWSTHGRNQPAGAGLQAVGPREIEDAVVAPIPVLEAAADLRLGRAGLEAHEGVREIVADVVVLRREIIRLGLALLTDQLACAFDWCMWCGIGPMLSKNFEYTGHFEYFFQIELPMRSAPHSATASARVKRFACHDDVAQTFVRRAVFVGGRSGGSEPALVDAAAIQTEGVEIVGMEFEPFARLQKGARHPARCEAEQAAGVFKRGFDERPELGINRFERRYRRLRHGKTKESRRG